MNYCSSKECKQKSNCAKNIFNIKCAEISSIANYYNSLCINYNLQERMKCLKCGEVKQIRSKGLCAWCYEKGKDYIKKRYYIHVKKNNIKKELIDTLRNEGKNFREIGEMVNLTRQRVYQIYSDNKRLK